MTDRPAEHDEIREFMVVVRRALLLIVAHIERRYDLTREPGVTRSR